MEIRIPTPDECEANAVVYESESKVGYAVWYPQMGGYHGRAVAVVDRTWWEHPHGSACGGCIDCYVWHDGEFPFDESDGRPPHVVHHCDAKQFIEFGKQLAAFVNKHQVEPPLAENKDLDKE